MSERDGVGKPTKRNMRSWAKRAETIRRKAEDLSYDIGTVTGLEHYLTDYADNVVHMSEELVWELSKPNPLSKAK